MTLHMHTVRLLTQSVNQYAFNFVKTFLRHVGLLLHKALMHSTHSMTGLNLAMLAATKNA